MHVVPLSRLAQRFRSPDVEGAYCERHTREFSSRSRAATYLAAVVLPEIAFAVTALACPLAGDRPSGIAYVVAAVASAAVATASVVVCQAVSHGSGLARAQELACLFAGVAFAAATVFTRFSGSGCDGTASEAARSGDEDGAVPPAFLSAASSALCALSFATLGATPWPRAALGVSVTLGLQAAALLFLVVYWRASETWFLCLSFALCSAMIGILLSCLSWERRKDYATAVVLQREVRQADVDHTNTEAVVSALFPADFARQVAEASVQKMRVDAVMDSRGDQLALPGEEPERAQNPCVYSSF
eukprot:m51a1_g6411 hypothetical protein (303) ;mRNA; f:268015-268923